MTIVVLEFRLPDGPLASDLIVLVHQVTVYALSFFWLGIMLINVHSTWNRVEKISVPVMLTNIDLLFFASMIPYFTLYLSNFMNEKIPRLLYGIDAVIIILFNQLSAEILKKDNPALLDYLVSIRKAVARDIRIKIVGIIVGAVVWPQAVLVSVFV